MSENDNGIEELLGALRSEGAVDSPEGHRKRVREMVDRNPDFTGFNDYQMLEWLLFATIARKDTKAIAKNLIHTFGSLSAVLHADYYELLRVPDVGDKTAHLLSNVLPVVLRAEYSRYEGLEKLSTAERASWYLFSRFLGQNKEILLLTSLNVNDEVIQTDEISRGRVDGADVDVMKILRSADRNGAKKIIMAHNHPGGTMMFSDDDIETTARVVSCCMMTGFIFYDHLIFSGTKYVSLFGNNELNKVINLSQRICSKMSVSLTAEKTRLQAVKNILQLGESDGSPNGGNETKMHLLQAYDSLLKFGDKVETQQLFNSMVKQIKNPLE